MVAVIQKGAKKLNSQRSSMRGSVSRRRVRWVCVCVIQLERIELTLLLWLCEGGFGWIS